MVSSSTDSTTEEECRNDRSKKKVRRKLIISSDSSDRCKGVSEENDLSEGDSSSEGDFQETRRPFRGKGGYISRKPKRKNHRGIITTSSDVDSDSESVEGGVNSSGESDEKGSPEKDKDVQGWSGTPTTPRFVCLSSYHCSLPVHYRKEEEHQKAHAREETSQRDQTSSESGT